MAYQTKGKGLYSQWVLSEATTRIQKTRKGKLVHDRINLRRFTALPSISKTKERKELADDKGMNGSNKKDSEHKISVLSEERTDDKASADYSDKQTADDFKKNPSSSSEAFEDENSEDDESADAELENCLLFEFRKRAMRMYQCEDHTCNNCVEDLEYVFRQHYRNQQKTTGILLDLGLLELSQRIWAKYFRGCFGKLQAELEKPLISEVIEGKAVENRRRILSSSCNLVVSMTDFSESACRKMIEMELHVDLISYLRSSRLQLLLAMKNDQATEQVDSMLHVLHNVVQVVPEARELYRQRGIVDVLKKFRTCKDEDISCLSLMFLAWVVNEDDIPAIDSGEEVFKYLFEVLESCVSKLPQRSSIAFKATEILEAINKLAAHDANKERIIRSGGLPILAEFLQPNVVKDEQYLAAKIIWTLAFKCAGDIIKEESCVKCLESLLEIEEVDDSVKRLARGALSTLGIPLLNSQNHARSSPNGLGRINEGKSLKKQIFISYNHGSKEIVFRIRDHLQQHGHDVWIDADEISGSLDEDIIEGIDGSSVVLVCLSQKYYESPNCRKEVTYADDTKKNIIPVTVESNYKPQGWLQFRLSDKLRIDFSQSQTFADSLKTLLQRLRKCFETTADELVYKTKQDEKEVKVGKQYGHVVDVSEVNVDDSRTSPSLVKTTTTTTTTTSGVASWTAEDVRKWLEERQLENLKDFFGGYDGRMLLCYKSLLLNRTSDCFEADFVSKFSVREFVQLNIALQNL